MRNKLPFLILILLVTVGAYAQAPELINYQAVARDAANQPLENTAVNVGFAIRQGSPSGTIVYSETHSGTTNQYGLFTMQIGGGTPASGVFSTINWGSGLYYLQVTVNGNVMPATQLLSVPYALHANTASTGTPGTDGHNSLINSVAESSGSNCPNGGYFISVGSDINNDGVLQVGEVSNSYYVCNGLDASAMSNDTSAINELQDLSITGNTISITNGVGANISAVAPATGDYLYWNGTSWVAQAPAANTDNQNLVDGPKVGNRKTINIQNGTGVTFSVADEDSLTTNEIQQLTFASPNLSLSLGGGTVDLSGLNAQSLSYVSASQSLSVSNGNTVTLDVNDADADPTNEFITRFDVNGSSDSLIIDEGGNHHAVPFSAFNDGDWTVNGAHVETANSGNVGIGLMHSTIGGPGYFLTSRKALTIAAANSYDTGPPAALELVGSSAANADIMGRVAFGHVVNAPTPPTYVGGIEMNKGGDMLFSTGGNNERLRLRSNGFMGLGTASPGYKFHVFQATGSGDIVLESPLAGNLKYRLINTNTDYAFELTGVNLNIEQAGTDLMTFNSGNVGIGTVPTEKLDVNGNTKSGNFIYAVPKERYLTIGETDFRLARSADAEIESSFGTGGVGIVNSSGSNALVAPVYLPHRAVIDSIVVYYVDNSTEDMSITLQSRSLTGGLSNIDAFTTSGSNTAVRKSAVFATGTTINNQNSSYNLRVYSTGWPSGPAKDMAIMTVQIIYTITETD